MLNRILGSHGDESERTWLLYVRPGGCILVHSHSDVGEIGFRSNGHQEIVFTSMYRSNDLLM